MILCSGYRRLDLYMYKAILLYIVIVALAVEEDVVMKYESTLSEIPEKNCTTSTTQFNSISYERIAITYHANCRIFVSYSISSLTSSINFIACKCQHLTHTSLIDECKSRLKSRTWIEIGLNYIKCQCLWWNCCLRHSTSTINYKPIHPNSLTH